MRNALTPWKVAFYLAAIFVAGAVSGWMVSGRYVREKSSTPPRLDEIARALRSCMHGQLDLTDDQREKVDAIIERNSREMQAMHGENMKRIRQVVSNRTAQLNAVLTPDQQKQFTQIEKERWDLLRNKDRERDRDREKWRTRGSPGRDKGERRERGSNTISHPGNGAPATNAPP